MKTSHSMMLLCLLIGFAGCDKQPVAPSKTLDDYIALHGKPVLSADAIELNDGQLVIVNPTILGDEPFDAKGKTLLLSKNVLVEADLKMLETTLLLGEMMMGSYGGYQSGDIVIVHIDKDDRPSEPHTEALTSVHMKTEPPMAPGTN